MCVEKEQVRMEWELWFYILRHLHSLAHVSGIVEVNRKFSNNGRVVKTQVPDSFPR